MAKKKKAPRKAQLAAAAAEAKAAAAPNLFERLHSRKKFSILGKRAKGEQRPSGKLRSEAVEKVCLSIVRACIFFVAALYLGITGGLWTLLSVRRRCSWNTSSCGRPTLS